MNLNKCDMKKKITTVCAVLLAAFWSKAQAPEIVKDVYVGMDGSIPWELTKVGDRVFYLANDGITGQELWVTDGTDAGTSLVFDFVPGSNTSWLNGLTEVNGTLYLQGVDASGMDNELYKSDGTIAGTVLVKDINTSGASWPSDFVEFGNSVLFSANDGVYDEELWISDGTEVGTYMVKDINPGAGMGGPGELYNWNGTVYFTANDGTSSYELWKTDGTSAGTILVKDINPGSAQSYPFNFCSVGNVLYFVATDALNGQELWKTDGTEMGTVLVKDIAPGVTQSNVDNLIEFNNQLFFTANDGTNGFELWKSDGTAGGTVIVKDIYNSPGQGNVEHLFVFNNSLFFSASDAIYGKELWKSDGTEAGTVLVKDIRVGGNGSTPDYFEAANGKLFFQAYEDVNGTELWVTDGTEAGTYLFADINTSGDATPRDLIAVQDVLLFAADNGTNGDELFKICPLLDNTVSVNGAEITANATNVTYQWVDCDNGNAPIVGATNQNFIPAVSGNYAVEITSQSTFGGCSSQLSACTLIDYTGLSEMNENQVRLHPNPSTGILNIQSETGIQVIEIVDLSGQTIVEKQGNGGASTSFMVDVKPGVYFVKVSDSQGNLHITQWIKL